MTLYLFSKPQAAALQSHEVVRNRQQTLEYPLPLPRGLLTGAISALKCI
jgi:hypothetical protein